METGTIALIAFLGTIIFSSVTIIGAIFVVWVEQRYRKIKMSWMARYDNMYWDLVSIVEHSIPDSDRDKLIKRYANMPKRRWRTFVDMYGNIEHIVELIRDIEMLRSLK